MTHRAEPTSKAALLAMLALTLLSYGGGWLILLSDGFYHQHTRYSPDATFVATPLAWVMAGLNFTVATIGVAALLQSRGASRRWIAVGCAAAMGPAVFFLLTRLA